MQGSDLVEVFPDLDGSGNAPPRGGWSVRAAVRHTADGPLVAEPVVVFGPGRVELSVPGAVSAGWSWRRARYEIVLAGPSGERERFASGRVHVDPSLVR